MLWKLLPTLAVKALWRGVSQGQKGHLKRSQSSSCKTNKDGKGKTGCGGACSRGNKIGSFPVSNVDSEITIEDRSEKGFAADVSSCAIPSEAKIIDERKTNVIQVVLMHCYLKLMSLVEDTVEFQRFSAVLSANSSVDAEENSDLHQVKQGQEPRPLAPWPLLAHLCHIAVLTSVWRDSSLWPPIDCAPFSLLLLLPAFPLFSGDDCFFSGKG